MSVSSSPAGFQVGAKYVFTGKAPAGGKVTIWWATDSSGGWRTFGSTVAASNGTYRLVLPINSAAVFRFVATGGNAPGAAGWQSGVAQVVAGTSNVLRVTSSSGAFSVGASYVFAGRATPNSPVTVWWDAQPYRGWRAFGKAKADPSGAFRLVLPINSAARFRFTATAGAAPGSGGWETNPSYVNAHYAGGNPSVLSVISNPGGFYVGSNYVFAGKTTPGMPVTIWWDAPPFKNWRVFTRLTAGRQGNFRVTLPITSAATFRFAATSGHSPSVRTADGWQTGVIGVRVSARPSMVLDPRCKTGRAICVSKSQYELAWVVNGQIQFTMDVRFGSASKPTYKGNFRVNWKSRNHVSSIYGSAMPFSLFFDGGRAVHYSRSFAEFGYNGNSAGCVNTRDYALTGRLFDLARVGDKVIVY